MSKNQVNYKTDLHKIKNSQTIPFNDKQSGDRVDIIFKLDGGEEGFYSEEYRPSCHDDYSKRIDITCGVNKTSESSVEWNLYEVKKSLTGEDKIRDVFEQFEAGYYYLKNGYLKDYNKNSGHFGIFTGKYDEVILNKKISASEERVAVVKSGKKISLGQLKIKQEINKKELEIELMKSLIKKEFVYPKTGEVFSIDIQMMNKINGQNVGTLIVQYK